MQILTTTAAPIQVTAVPDPALTAAATRHGLRRPILFARLAGWATLGVTLLVELVTGELSLSLLVLGVVLAVVVPILLLRVATPDAGRVTTFAFSAEGVASSSALTRHSYAWSAFRSVELLPGQLVFRMGGVRFLAVPTAGLRTLEIGEVLRLAAAGGVPSSASAAF